MLEKWKIYNLQIMIIELEITFVNLKKIFRFKLT